MSKRGKMVTCLVLALVMVVSCVPLFASAASSVSRETIYLPENQVWADASTSVTHTSGHSSAAAQCHRVYPVYSSIDLFFNCQCRVLTTSGTVISGVHSLNENATSITAIPLQEGMQSVSRVDFEFRGNTSKAAYAVVSYYGTN